MDYEQMSKNERMAKLKNLVEKQNFFFHSGQTRNISFRLEQLKLLKSKIKAYEDKINQALRKDLNKSLLEVYATEIAMVYGEINHTVKNLRSWAKPSRVKTPLSHFGSTGYIYPEPYGLALIISPWNYPFQLVICPLAGAIAAGNCAIIKPSELCPNITGVIAELIQECFPEEYIAVVEGGIETAKALLAEKFDYIFYTGSPAVGKIVMEAAAQNLTPLTLELGGKSPCIVHNDADLSLAAKRIVWGKCINAGQTCVAPDYLLVHKNIKEKFLENIKNAIQESYGKDVTNNEDFPVIINDRHFQRLVAYLENGQVLTGGRYDEKRRFIEPTVIDQVNWNCPIMQDEIFGPLLPVMEYEDLSEVFKMVNDRPKPLALYFFSNNKNLQNKVINNISYGGGCINDTIFHLVSPYLPFGGVGNSGIGSYHGKSSFDTFSHKKSVLHQTTLFDLPARYPNFKYALKVFRMLFH
jgi:aldehyde dehydrogenase (NAD+)